MRAVFPVFHSALLVTLSSLLFLSLPLKAEAQAAVKQADVEAAANLDQLLQRARDYQRQERTTNVQREQRFVNDKQQQQRLLNEAKQAFLAAQKIGNPLQQQVDAQQQEIDTLRQQLQEEAAALGDVQSLFNEFRGDFAARMQDSLVQAQMPERAAQLAIMQRDDELPTIASMRELWLAVLEEMSEAAKQGYFTADVVAADGSRTSHQVLRLGTFTAYADGQMLRFIPASGELLALTRQPPERAEMQAFVNSSITHANTLLSTAIIDPSRGELLGLLGQSPGLYERLMQGREVGLVIIALGAGGLLFALYRLIYLLILWLKTRAQMQNIAQPRDNNPLGRVLQQAQRVESAASDDEELLQLSLDEAVIREIPALESGHSLIKLFAAIAPLLGLLGTVIGMIATFQSISLFGSGDPKLMASGISQALVTTVLGLVVAIPLLLSHNMLVSFSRLLVQILDEQSAGLLARDKEAKTGRKQQDDL